MPSLDIAAGASAAGSSAAVMVKLGPALIGVALVAAVGISFLMRNEFNRRPHDDDWFDPHQPQENEPLFIGPDQHKDPAGVDPAMRERYYPPNLQEDPNSIIGRC